MSSSEQSSKPKGSFLRRKEGLIGLGVFALFAGMLFWTKLRVVENIPRSAYAEPEERHPADENSSADDRIEPNREGLED